MGQAICNEEIPNPTSFLYIRMMRVAGGRRTRVVAASVVIAVSQQSHYIWLRWGDMESGCSKWWPSSKQTRDVIEKNMCVS